MVYIFIDDSGTLHDPHETVVTVAALITRQPFPLRWIIRRVRRGVRRKPSKNLPAEFKFYNTTDETRGRVLAALAREDVTICALSVHKGKQQVEDTPENFAILLCTLLERCLPSDSTVEVVMDIHFSQKEKQRQVGRLVQRAFGLETAPQFVDSQANPFVQLADFVVGAVKHAHTGRTTVYYQFIRSKIVGDEIRSWKDVKREWLERARRKQKE